MSATRNGLGQPTGVSHKRARWLETPLDDDRVVSRWAVLWQLCPESMSSSARPPGRSTLARSKSLRLPRPTAQPQSKDDLAQPEGGCQLRRHGSMRAIGGAAATTTTGRSKPRPESKPTFAASATGKSSPEEDEAPMKEHFARLVQEHDRLQVKGPWRPSPRTRQTPRMGSCPPCVRDSPLLMGLHLEAQRLQQELRRAQRAYWDLVLGSDSGDDSAEVVVDLLSQLEKRDTELSRARGRCERLSEALAQSEREVAACRDALHDYQLQMEAQRAAHEAQRSHVHDLQVQLGEAREGCEFLQAERATLAEAQLESEAEMRRLRGLLEAALETSRILYQRCAKLFAKCQQKSVRLSQLESQLECQRPIAEATASSGQALAQLSAKLQAFLKTSVLFAASHLQLDSEVLDEIMDDLEGSGDEHPAAPAPSKDRLAPLDVSFANGDSEPDSSYGTPVDELPPSTSAEHSSLVHAILQAAAGSQLLAQSEDLPMKGESEVHDKLAERSNLCVAKRTLVDCNGVSGEGRLGGQLPPAGSVAEEAGLQSARSPAVSHTNGFHADDGAVIFRPNQCLATSLPSGVSGSSENGLSSQVPSDEDAAQSSVSGKPVGTVPPFRTVAATDSKPMAGTGGAGVGGHERAVAELASLSGKLVRIHSLMQARVQERMRTDHEQIEELKQNLDTVCRQKAQCGLEAGELRRQRDQACEHAQRLEQQMASLQDSHAREVELLFQQMGDLKEKNRCLSAVNQEQGRQLQEELSKRGFSSEADAICAKLQLRQELEQLREELLLKDEQLRALAAKFGRFRKAYEDNYQRATDDIDKLDTMLERVIETLEAEPEAVSSCPALRQLLHNLRGGGAGDAASTPSGDSLTNRKMPTAL
ncbi:hypothetical protein MTO96_012588 [Rhipicephalus appendiculatus]